MHFETNFRRHWLGGGCDWSNRAMLDCTDMAVVVVVVDVVVVADAVGVVVVDHDDVVPVVVAVMDPS